MAADIQALKKVSRDKSNDCTFVGEALEMLYKDNLSTLYTKSIRGGKRRMVKDGVMTEYPATEAISPGKYNALKSQYESRIEGTATDDPEHFEERMSDAYFRRNLSYSIKNIRTRLTKQYEKENQTINLRELN